MSLNSARGTLTKKMTSDSYPLSMTQSVIFAVRLGVLTNELRKV